ncbi:MAG: uncharacterized protein PWR10_2117 [Halanaerobiales bacterium]|nr:uncharacterized protein [Halanaerobiales bacterium]
MRQKYLYLTVLLILLTGLVLSGRAYTGAADFAGTWKGAIIIGANKLEIHLELKVSEDGALTGNIDIPAQGAVDLPLVDFRLDGSAINFKIANVPGDPTFNGKLKGNSIEGSFFQSGQTFPFKVERAEETPEVKEPDDYATGEYDITEKEVEIPVEGGTLAGTLTIPEEVEGPLQAAVLVAGSGPTDRNGNNPLIPQKVDTLKEIAYYLSSRGILTLRYDKRGIAGSKELFKGSTPPFRLFMEDVLKSVEYVQSLAVVNPDRVYIVGHSEGATLAAMAAAESNDLAGIVLIAGPGFKHSEVLRKQVAEIGAAEEAAGAPDGFQKQMLKALDDLYDAIRNDTTFDFSGYGILQKYAAIYLSLYNQKEFARDWLEVDPAEYLKKVNIPVCVIQGTTDSRVSEEDARALAAAAAPEKRELHIFEGVNHFLKKAPRGMVESGKRIYGELLEAIYLFIKQH